MVKNVYRCEKCKAQIIAQNKVGCTTPFMIMCRGPGCKHTANSTMYSIAQDVLADAHLEFVHEGGTSGDNIVAIKQLREVTRYNKDEWKT